jgi:mono/diheme cytochrome c family protein
MNSVSRVGSAVVIIAVLMLAGCGDTPRESARQDAQTGRWYSVEQVMQGSPLYARHCAVCHGGQAEGAETWFQRLPDGRWPPPALNGTAHAWHHPLWQLRQQIRLGSDPRTGNMPGFEEILSDAEIDSVIAWFQSHWPPEIYAAWLVYDANTPEDPGS